MANAEEIWHYMSAIEINAAERVSRAGGPPVRHQDALRRDMHKGCCEWTMKQTIQSLVVTTKTYLMQWYR